jgi:hypothetical protein
MVNFKSTIRRLPGGPVALKPIYRFIDRQLWVTLSESVSTRPISAAAFNHKDRDPSEYSMESTADGYFKELEWGFQPDWYRRDTHWRTWIPNAVPLSWYDMHSNSILNESIDTSTGSGNDHRIPSRFQQSTQKHLQDAYTILSSLQRRVRQDNRNDVPFPVPPAVHIENAVFHSRLLLFQHLRSIQRGFLEILGAIRWIAAWDDDIDANLGYVRKDVEAMGIDLDKRFSEWQLRLPGGRGVLVDLARDWRDINIALYVDHGIPVHYIWTKELQLDPRFRSLNPTFLGAVAEGLLSQPLPDWVERPSTGKPLVTTHRADQFLQLYHPPRAVITLSSGVQGSKMQDFVVDFEGWKARRVYKEDKKKYMNELWYEETPGKSDGHVWSRRTFHRYCRSH